MAMLFAVRMDKRVLTFELTFERAELDVFSTYWMVT